MDSWVEWYTRPLGPQVAHPWLVPGAHSCLPGNPSPPVAHAVLTPEETQYKRVIIVGDIHGCPGEAAACASIGEGAPAPRALLAAPRFGEGLGAFHCGCGANVPWLSAQRAPRHPQSAARALHTRPRLCPRRRWARCSFPVPCFRAAPSPPTRLSARPLPSRPALPRPVPQKSCRPCWIRWDTVRARISSCRWATS